MTTLTQLDKEKKKNAQHSKLVCLLLWLNDYYLLLCRVFFSFPVVVVFIIIRCSPKNNVINYNNVCVCVCICAVSRCHFSKHFLLTYSFFFFTTICLLSIFFNFNFKLAKYNSLSIFISKRNYGLKFQLFCFYSNRVEEETIRRS